MCVIDLTSTLSSQYADGQYQYVLPLPTIHYWIPVQSHMRGCSGGYTALQKELIITITAASLNSWQA